MITHIRIRNFKTLEDTEFDLGPAPAVLIGPNNCGKTSILQALTMWQIGARAWEVHRTWRKGEGGKPRGVGITLKNLPALVAPEARMFWNRREVRTGDKNVVWIRIDVAGETKGKEWCINTEFRYGGREIIYCRPSTKSTEGWEYLPNIAFLQPMSGLADEEDKLMPGSINGILGKGKTADVLRNICYQLFHPDTGEKSDADRGRQMWEKVKKHIWDKFVVKLNDPKFESFTGKIEVKYQQDGRKYDLSAGGRGFHQTLLLLTYLYSNPGSVVLLDEPDAHLEIIRQSDTFSLLRDVAKEQNSQLIIASHSEVILKESAELGSVMSIVKGHAKNLLGHKQISQFRKLLTSIGWNVYNLASIKKHIVFVEGSTDKNMLIAFAQKLGMSDERIEKIRRTNFMYVGNKTEVATSTFYGLREALPDLRGFALFDRSVGDGVAASSALEVVVWQRNEIESYLPLPAVLYRFAETGESIKLSELKPLLQEVHVQAMRETVARNTAPKALEDSGDKFWRDAKMSEYLARVFDDFYQRLNLRVRMEKSRYHLLVEQMTPEEVPDEVKSVIERIFAVIEGDGDEQGA